MELNKKEVLVIIAFFSLFLSLPPPLKEVMYSGGLSVCLFICLVVCLSARLLKKFRTDVDEIVRRV